MSRGAQQSTRNLIDQQLNNQNQLLSQTSQQGTQDRSLLMPAIQNLLNSPGYSPAEKSAITQQGMGSARTAYDALNQAAQNQAARTNNGAASGAITAQLGRQQADNLSQQARQNQISFANQKLNQQLAGLNSLGQTYGVDTNLLGHAMGVPSTLLGARATASGGSTLSGLGGLFGGLGNVGSLLF